jgi:hypothetical protein
MIGVCLSAKSHLRSLVASSRHEYHGTQPLWSVALSHVTEVAPLKPGAGRMALTIVPWDRATVVRGYVTCD